MPMCSVRLPWVIGCLRVAIVLLLPGKPDREGMPMLLTSEMRGVLPIAPTPFLGDGTVDTASIDRLADFYVAAGATGVTVLGQLGEAPKLDHAEGVAIAKQFIAR